MQKGGVIRPSPNEEAEFLRKERERRRVQRLVQVREQSRQHAQRIRTGYHQLRQEEEQFQENMQKALHKEENLRKMTVLQNKLKCYIDDVGTGHRSAAKTMEKAAIAQRQKEAAMEEERLKTGQRYGRALNELNRASQSKREKKEFHIKARQSALVVERHRAKEVASLPPPQQDLPVAVEPSKGHRVVVKGVGGFSCTHYNLPTHSVVQRTGPRDMAGLSGVDSAAETAELSAQAKHDAERQREEREEKAWLRHKHALAQIRLEREHRQGLQELEQLERQYRSARQQQVAEMPANLFQPTQQLLDMKKEKQREMERAFEKPCLKSQATQFAMEWTLSDSSMTTPGTAQSASHEETSQLDSEGGDSHMDPPTPPTPQVPDEEGSGGTLRPTAPPRTTTTLPGGGIDSRLSDSPHSVSSEAASEGVTPPVPSTLPALGSNKGHPMGGELVGRRAMRGQDTLSVCDIDSCFTASPASEATSSTSPVTHDGGTSLSIVDEDEHANNMLLPSTRQLSAVMEEEGESTDEEDDESTLREEKTDTEEDPNTQHSPGAHIPPPSLPGDGNEDVFSSLSSSDVSLESGPEGSIPGEEEDSNPPARDGSAEDCPPKGVYATAPDTGLQTMPVNGLEEMLANIRRQHEVWTDYLAEAGQGTLPYSHVTVTRPQQFLPLEDVESSQVSYPPTPLSILTLGSSSPESDTTLSSSLSSRTSGLSWVNLPEVEPLGPGLPSSTPYILPGPSTALSYPHPTDQATPLVRLTADGTAVVATPKSSLLSQSTSASPHVAYPLLPAAAVGTSFQHTRQFHPLTRVLPATALPPPGVIRPRPSPSNVTPPSSSEPLSGEYTHVSLHSTPLPTLSQPSAHPSHQQLPLASPALVPQHRPAYAQPLLPPSSVSVAPAGALREPLSAAVGPTAPHQASTAAAPTLQSAAQCHLYPVASLLDTSVQSPHHKPTTVFASTITSHSAGPVQQAQSTLLSSAPTTQSQANRQQPLHHRFAVSTPLGHKNTSLDSPPPTSMHISQKPPVFPITTSSCPLPSPGLSSVRSSAHAVPTTAATSHRGYPYSPLLTSPITSGSDDSVLTKSSSSGVELPTTSHPPEHSGQGEVSSHSNANQPSLHPLEPVLCHGHDDPSPESSSISHSSSLSSLTPHGIIQSLLVAHRRREEEGEVTLQSSTFSPLQSDLSHLELSGGTDSFIAPPAPEAEGHTGNISYSPTQQPDSPAPHALSVSEGDRLPEEDSPTKSAPAEEKPSMTLQEAFLLKKSLFIQRSQERQRLAMAKAKQAQSRGGGAMKASTGSLTTAQLSDEGQSGELATSTEDSQPSSTGPCHREQGQPRSTSVNGKRSVTFSSPVTVLQSSGLFSPPEVHNSRGLKAHSMVQKTVQPRAMTKAEMVAVNQRLYGRLPEVQRERKEQEKRRMYETNRAKAKEYQKKVQDRLRKQRKSGPSSKPQSAATSKPIHSAPFK